MAIKYPEFYRKITKAKIGIVELEFRNDHFGDLEQNSNSQENHQRTIWHFLEIFLLSNGHYFGFESTTNHSWYLTRSIVDIISSIFILNEIYLHFFFP
jgi:hypothetical protein